MALCEYINISDNSMILLVWSQMQCVCASYWICMYVVWLQTLERISFSHKLRYQQHCLQLPNVIFGYRHEWIL